MLPWKLALASPGCSMCDSVCVCVCLCTHAQLPFVWVLVKPYSTPSLHSGLSLSYFLWSYKVKPQHLWFCRLLTLFPHLLLFPYQPAYDSASSASKLYKTQGKLPQRDTTLLFPMLLLPLPHRRLFLPSPLLCMSQIKVCTSALAAHHGSGAWNKFNILHQQIHVYPTAWERNPAPPVRLAAMWERTQSFTKGHRWSSGLLSNLSLFVITPFFRRLIRTKTSILPSSGLKAMLVAHQVWFSTSDNFFREGKWPEIGSSGGSHFLGQHDT